MEFLNRHGEGVHHVSFGEIDDHDEIVAALREHGIGMEMQGNVEDCFAFTYTDTQHDMGTIFEFRKPISTGGAASLKPWGTLPAPEQGAISMEGKEIVQVGLVKPPGVSRKITIRAASFSSASSIASFIRSLVTVPIAPSIIIL